MIKLKKWGKYYKKITYNIFYKPVVEFIHMDGTIFRPNLWLFTEEEDASLAINLMYDIESTLRKKLIVKLSPEHWVEEK